LYVENNISSVNGKTIKKQLKVKMEKIKKDEAG